MNRIATIACFILLGFGLSVAQWTTGKSADVVLGKTNFLDGFANTLDSIALSGPYDVAVDPTTGKIFVADFNHNRVLRYSAAAGLTNGVAAEGVLGQPGFKTNAKGTTATTMNRPWALAFDALGNVYVSEAENNRVLRFNNASAKANGAAADGVFGQPNFTSGGAGLPVSSSNMYWPQGVAVDKYGNLYVGIYNQSRVMRFDSAATKTVGGAANVVFGQTSLTLGNQVTTQAGMRYAAGVAVDTSGTLWVSDNGNNRILRFDSAWAKSTGAVANGVLSAATYTVSGGDISSPKDLCIERNGTLWVACMEGVAKYVNAKTKVNGADPELKISLGITVAEGVAVDTAGNLYVADDYRYRVIRFNDAKNKTIANPPDVVFGKPLMTSVYQNSITASGLSRPSDVAVDDATGKVFVSDTYNARILRFASVHALTSGLAAEAVLGVSDFVTSIETPAVSATTVVPESMTMDAAGRLWVVDGRNRILRYDNAATKANNAPADGVLGQPNFTSTGNGTTATTLKQGVMSGLAAYKTTLYVSDYNNHRVLRFDSAAYKANGAAADGVLGQSGFTTAVAGLTQSLMTYPSGVAVDVAGNLYVADAGNNRVLRYDSAHVKANGAPADAVFGQTSFTLKNNTTGQNTLQGPTDVVVDGQGTLYVSEENPSRVMVWKNPLMQTSGASATYVLGQTNFTNATVGLADNRMNKPYGLCVVNSPTGRLLVADSYNSRVLRFSATTALTDVEEPGSILPTEVSLSQNYPNPFNPTTVIQYTISDATSRHAVMLRVYDLLGRVVATLVNETQSAGEHAVTFNASQLSSGVYLYRLEVNGEAITKRMLLMK